MSGRAGAIWRNEANFLNAKNAGRGVSGLAVPTCLYTKARRTAAVHSRLRPLKIRSFKGYDRSPERELYSRCGHPVILRLDQPSLADPFPQINDPQAGILEDGIVTTSETGTGQGSMASPLAFAKSFVAQHACRFDHIVEHGFLTGQNLHRCHHAGNDRQRMLGGSEVVLVGAHDDPIKGFLSLAPIGLFIDDRVGADALDLALERAVDRRIVGA